MAWVCSLPPKKRSVKLSQNCAQENHFNCRVRFSQSGAFRTESKDEFLERILQNGSTSAKILKCADRISNLTDLHTDIFDKEFIKNYIEETKRWVFPMAEQVNKNMLHELKDIVQRRERHFRIPTHIWPLTRKDKEG